MPFSSIIQFYLLLNFRCKFKVFGIEIRNTLQLSLSHKTRNQLQLLQMFDDFN